jgi:SAM-dependent methyltransferase
MADPNAPPFGTAVDAPSMTHWDRVAESTSWGRYLSEVEKQVILRAEALVEKPARGVDLGCGGGRWSRMLASRGWSMTCLDVNRQALAICQRNVPSATCVLGQPKAQRLPLPPGSAELALCIEVIPLIESDWFQPEVKRVLAPGGVFVGVYINGRSLRGLAWRIKNRFTHSDDDIEFYRSNYREWKRQLLAMDFEMLHEESCCWGPFTRCSNSPFVPAVAKLERVLRLHRVLTFSPWVVFIARKLG